MNRLINRIALVAIVAAPVWGDTTPGLTLETCLQAARATHPAAEAAEHRIRAAAAAIDEVRAGFLPTVSLSGMYTRTDNPPQAFFMQLNQRRASFDQDFNQPDDTENLRLSALARITLLDGGQRTVSMRMAGLQALSASERAEAVYQELTFHVTRAFYLLQQARENLRVQEAHVERIRENLRVARARHDAGAALKTDVLHLEVQEAEAAEQLIRAGNQARLAISALNTAIGSTLVDNATPLALDPQSPLPDLPGLNSSDLERRPEWAAWNHETEAGALDVERIRRDRWPRLSAFGSVDWDSEVSSDFEQSYLAGAVVEWDAFTGYRRRSEQARAEARRLELEAGRRQLEQQLALELEQAYFNAHEARERLEVARRATVSAGEAYRITRSRYEEGAADITELLTAQVGLTAAETRGLNARYDYLTALANYQRARGGATTPE
ncbi:MAG TPA: TolC family protein [Kiritimatiellia bacterium]|nr:TolC family protein [Kiritimatiellia bacterium]HMO98015.1 TolC family protein [Kiritimatiellia bacterium]HMP97466.1 TolC family protein [Kiritimatiellia bacterium]